MPKKKAMPMGEGLLKEAADSEEPVDAPEEAAEPEYDENEAMRDAFMEMAKAIRDGDDEAAFAAYQECQGKG
jgi:hypothetical protein